MMMKRGTRVRKSGEALRVTGRLRLYNNDLERCWDASVQVRARTWVKTRCDPIRGREGVS